VLAATSLARSLLWHSPFLGHGAVNVLTHSRYAEMGESAGSRSVLSRNSSILAIAAVTMVVGISVVAKRTGTVWFRKRFPYVQVACTRTKRPVWPSTAPQKGVIIAIMSCHPPWLMYTSVWSTMFFITSNTPFTGKGILPHSMILPTHRLSTLLVPALQNGRQERGA
jgi:hypothetical protein